MKAIKKTAFLIILLTLSTGCSSGMMIKYYAQNKFNPTGKIKDKGNSGVYINNGAEYAVVASNAASPPPLSGVGFGLSAIKILRNLPPPPDIGVDTNLLILNMPASLAKDKDDAQILAGSMVESAIQKSLPEGYESRIEEYEDKFPLVFSSYRPRWFRVNGNKCENWSCQIVVPIPTKNALQWSGKIKKGQQDTGEEVYLYDDPLLENRIGFVKIEKEYTENDRKIVIGSTVKDFDYGDFYKKVSNNLPDWILIYISEKNNDRFYLKSGLKLEKKI
ncbi:hypothetical protein [Methylomonas sp. AM2-LC]|uniref:hypothetical protein n=1 Tax=Methylomonas sp. AM2-LC TaxID=3153301 RepID=UPI0032679BD4